MADYTWKKKDLHGFQEAVQSLKLYRRAELMNIEDGKLLIDSLYVDPQPQEQVFETLKRAHTTFLIGRKGTGKSTLFQRLQSELRRSKHQTSAYIDIKTVYESSQADSELLSRLHNSGLSLSKESMEKLLLYKQFLQAVIEEVKIELKERIKSSIWVRTKEFVSGDIENALTMLDDIYIASTNEQFISVLGIKKVDIDKKRQTNQEETNKRGFGAELSNAPKINLGYEKTNQKSDSLETQTEFSDILIRSFDLIGFISKLKNVLVALKIRHIHILIDDFSELPEDTMKIVVDVLLAPLNNWSNEFIKFKVAAYPGRIYYGQIDKTKIDELYLDLYKLYGSGDVSRMEDSAIDFTKRLVENRLRHFCNRPASDFFEEDSEVWRSLFFATMANPRTLGYILHFTQDSHLIRGKKIGIVAIQEASERFYTEKIEPYFSIGKFLHDSFNERSSIYSLKELLEAIVTKARDLRGHESKVMSKIGGRPPTSHFHIPVELENVFSTLELNFFLTKYFEMSDRSGKKVVVLALNHGLCSKYQITFGRPKGEREFRLYFVERFFDYSRIIEFYLEKNQEIICNSCKQRYSYEQLDALRFYGMLCKECKEGTVEVTNLSKKYANELSNVKTELLLPPTELAILQSLHFGKAPLRPGHIAGELDCSYQLIGKRGVLLSDMGLIKRYKDDQNSRLFEIDPTAEERYFNDEGTDELNLD
ncbi:hypothetical protein GCM10011387_16040 [Pedobacter quisquiliarum]|uniref:Uncharacterized protein n=1 Tax=Pedobacter quisquiliarum TaxID=1834438 RepID=A0A916U9P8_9SPHI|nr:hypothetical protein [Pedobacter quisquiliarum]GGC63218.1 hypothetical protein GCM10011387_16040 [Pedobacter quisquiliarum]